MDTTGMTDADKMIEIARQLTENWGHLPRDWGSSDPGSSAAVWRTWVCCLTTRFNVVLLAIERVAARSPDALPALRVVKQEYAALAGKGGHGAGQVCRDCGGQGWVPVVVDHRTGRPIHPGSVLDARTVPSVVAVPCQCPAGQTKAGRATASQWEHRFHPCGKGEGPTAGIDPGAAWTAAYAECRRMQALVAQCGQQTGPAEHAPEQAQEPEPEEEVLF